MKFPVVTPPSIYHNLMLPNRSIKYLSNSESTFACIRRSIKIRLTLSRREQTFGSISGSIRNYVCTVSSAEL